MNKPVFDADLSGQMIDPGNLMNDPGPDASIVTDAATDEVARTVAQNLVEQEATRVTALGLARDELDGRRSLDDASEETSILTAIQSEKSAIPSGTLWHPNALGQVAASRTSETGDSQDTQPHPETLFRPSVRPYETAWPFSTLSLDVTGSARSLPGFAPDRNEKAAVPVAKLDSTADLSDNTLTLAPSPKAPTSTIAFSSPNYSGGAENSSFDTQSIVRVGAPQLTNPSALDQNEYNMSSGDIGRSLFISEVTSENANSMGFKVGDPNAKYFSIHTSQAPDGTNVFSLYAKNWADPIWNFENGTDHQISVTLQSWYAPQAPDQLGQAQITFTVHNVDEAPTLTFGQSTPILEGATSTGVSVGSFDGQAFEGGAGLPTFSVVDHTDAFEVGYNQYGLPELRVKNGALIDYEDPSTYTVTLAATSPATGGGTLTTYKTVVVNVQNVNENNPFIAGAGDPSYHHYFDVDTTGAATQIQLFNGVSIIDGTDKDTITVTIKIDNPAKGTITNFDSGTWDAQSGTYTVSGSQAAVSQIIQALLFVPTARPNDPYGSGVPVSFTMTATDGYATDTNSNFNVIIDAQNRGPNAPIFYNDYQSQAYIQQHADDGEFIGQLIATDPNAGDTVIAYEIVNDPGNHFAIRDYGIVNGQEFFGLVANGPINYTDEDLIWGDGPPHYIVTVRAYDIHGTPGSLQDLYVYVNGNLAPDSLTFQDKSVTASVPEQQAGAILGTLTSHDKELDFMPGVVNPITIAPNGDPSGRFEVVGDAVSGYQLKLKDGVSLDYESLPDGAKFYNVILRVTDDHGATYDQIFTINVADVSPDWVNQSPDSLTFAGDTTNASVAENLRGAQIGVLVGHDPDSYDPPASLHFAIAPDGDPSGRFEVVGDVLKLKDGVALDYDSLPEGAEFYTVTVRVSDALGAYKDQVLTINVTDDPSDPTPNHDPDSLTFDDGKLEARIAVGDAAAQAGILLGHDPDAFDDGQLTYELVADASGNFVVEGNVLRLKDDVSLTEIGATYVVTIRVWDGHGGYKDQDLTIHSGRDIDNVYDIHSQADIDAIVEPTDPSGGNDKAYVYLDSFVLSDTLGIETIEAGSTVDHGISLTGNIFANTITGGIGNDTLSGGGVTGPVSETNHDVLSGGAGDDTYIVDQDGVVIEEAQDGGSADLVVLQDIAFASGAIYTLADNVEKLAANGTTGEVRLVGNDSDNLIIGNASADTLEGGAGSDTLDGIQGDAPDVLIGGAGNDTYFIRNVGDVIVEDTSNESDTAQVFVGEYHLAGDVQVENLKAGTGYSQAVHLVGNAYSYQITGGSFADTLDGGALGMGITHTLNGGAGDDVYYIVNTGDQIQGEVDGTGGTTALGANDVANLYRGLYADQAAIDAAVAYYESQGIETVNVLDGLPQGINDDAYDVTTQDDSINYPAGESPDPAIGGHDIAIVHIGDYTLGAGIGIETLEAGSDVSGISLTGNDLANTIIGSAGNDTLDGGGTANEIDGTLHDVLHGGAGDDIYVVSQDGIVITEVSGEGIDTVRLDGATFDVAWNSYTLADNVENLDASGSVGSVHLSGNGLDNLIIGNADTDLIEGGAGNDTLDGGAGNGTSDFLKGGDGNDVYFVHSSGDAVVETDDLGNPTSGTDTVKLDGVTFDAAWNSYTLADNVENLDASASTGSVVLSGNSLDNRITGNADLDILNGGDGNDTLDGGAGVLADRLDGGLGDDLFIVHSKDDVVLEAVGGGQDTVAVRTGEYHLAADAEVEVLKVDDGYASGAILEGNAYSTTLEGGVGSDVLSGGFAGTGIAHTLNGGASNDVYYIVNVGDEIRGELDGADHTTNGAQDIVVLYRGLYADDTALQNAIDHYLGEGVELYEVRDGVPTAGPNAAPVFDIADDKLTSTTAATGGLAHPFDGITLSDADGDSITLTVTFADAEGVLNNVTSTGGVTVSVDPVNADDGTRTYAFRGSATDLQAFLANVTFNPEDRTQGADVTTDFTFTVRDDFHGAVVPPETVQVVSTINDKPAFGIEEGQTAFTTDANAGIVNLFAGVNLGDAENNPITLKIAYDKDAGDLGGMTSTALVTVDDKGLDGANHVYTLTGAASDLQNFLDGVTFDPTNRATGGDVTTDFTLSVKDAYHEWEDHVGAVNVTSTVGATDPTALFLSDNSIREYPFADTFIGELSTELTGDYVYKIVLTDGSGNETLVDSDGRFKIVGNQLFNDTRLGLDFEDKSDYDLKVRVMKQGQTAPTDWHLDNTFPISLRDVFGENVTGSDVSERILGGIGNDILKGGMGDDTLSGGIGRDTLTGNEGSDFFLFNKVPTPSSRDAITDFTVGEDQIQLKASIFRLGTLRGDLTADRFVVGSEATTTSQRIIYEKTATSATLYYDADGSGTAAHKVEIAHFTTIKPTLGLTDFDIIG